MKCLLAKKKQKTQENNNTKTSIRSVCVWSAHLLKIAVKIIRRDIERVAEQHIVRCSWCTLRTAHVRQSLSHICWTHAKGQIDRFSYSSKCLKHTTFIFPVFVAARFLRSEPKYMPRIKNVVTSNCCFRISYFHFVFVLMFGAALHMINCAYTTHSCNVICNESRDCNSTEMKKKIISLFKHSVVELAVIVVLYRIWFSVWGDFRILVVVSQQKKTPPSLRHSQRRGVKYCTTTLIDMWAGLTVKTLRQINIVCSCRHFMY